ncbi:MAG: GNAT family N-acetyltransferase [Candidatus Phosphoribacter sp.]|nr:GNAT family N-acetyltransferase [Actinomycetales bacterium]
MNPAHLQVDRVHAWLSEDAYWALGRERAVVDAAIAGSRVCGAYRSLTSPDGSGMPGEQVAFARAVTDGATFAWICDVYVARESRGQGLGTRLVRALVDSLEAEGIQRVVLATRDAHEVYARLGFGPLANPATWMERDRRLQRPPAGYRVGGPASPDSTRPTAGAAGG